MPRSQWPYPWDLLTRYRLIEIVALWEGRLTSNHLCNAFGIGRQQASHDINAYNRAVGPGNLVMDRHIKGYKPAPGFQPQVTAGLADEYLALLNRDLDLSSRFDSLGLKSASTAVLGLPIRNVRPEVLRPLMQAAQAARRVEVEYVSFTNPEREVRVIAPHTLVFSGARWHVRAYCEKNRDYRDFVLSRFRGEADLMDESPNPAAQDAAWNTPVVLRIVPDTRLNAHQRSIIEQDYGMHDGCLDLPTRGALVQYLLQLLRIDLKTLDANPSAQQIIVENREALRQWLFN